MSLSYREMHRTCKLKTVVLFKTSPLGVLLAMLLQLKIFPFFCGIFCEFFCENYVIFFDIIFSFFWMELLNRLDWFKKNETNLIWFCTIFNQSLFCWKRTLVFCLRYSFDCISFKTALWRYYTVLANNSFQMSILWSISRKNFNLL